jgi:hypothetical protein
MFTCQDCPPAPPAWFGLRELLLHLLFTPALLLPLVAGAAALLAWRLQQRLLPVLALDLLSTLAVSTIYSPAATATLTAWLTQQGPAIAVVAPPSRAPCSC